MPLLRVAVGMSSGVDSAVSALILSKMSRRFELVGCFMRNWDTADETGMYCTQDTLFRCCILSVILPLITQLAVRIELYKLNPEIALPGQCRADKEAEEAEDICSRLGMPFRQVHSDEKPKKYKGFIYIPFLFN